MDRLAQVPLRYSPGDQWVYGLGHDVQAYLVEVFSGMRYEDYVQKTIFDPLGMRSTVFGVPPAMKARFATVYTRGADGKLVPDTADRYARFTDHAFGTLSLSGSAPDYLRFAQMLLNGGELDGKRVLKRETVALMMQNHVPDSWVPLTIAEGWAIGRSGFGYGGAVRMDSDPSVAGSAGTFRWAGYGTTFFWVDPKNNLIGMLWTQYMPVMENWALDGEFQRRVYAALVGDGRTAGRPEER
jgi:CubicO group peptidase (beta-lactamase class C family)